MEITAPELPMARSNPLSRRTSTSLVEASLGPRRAEAMASAIGIKQVRAPAFIPGRSTIAIRSRRVKNGGGDDDAGCCGSDGASKRDAGIFVGDSDSISDCALVPAELREPASRMSLPNEARRYMIATTQKNVTTTMPIVILSTSFVVASNAGSIVAFTAPSK